jgi:hypothetical protein
VPRCAGPGCFWDGTRCRSELSGATCTVGGSAPAPASQSSTLPGSLSNGSATTTAAAQQQAEIARQQRTPSVPESDKGAPSSCLVFGTKASNGILENRCAFPIDVTFCNEKGSHAFRCDANQYGNFTIGAHDEQTVGYSPSNGRFYRVVCRSPYSTSGADRRWDGTNIVAACK